MIRRYASGTVASMETMFPSEVTLTKVLFATFGFRTAGSVKYLCCSHIIVSMQVFSLQQRKDV